MSYHEFNVVWLWCIHDSSLPMQTNKWKTSKGLRHEDIRLPKSRFHPANVKLSKLIVVIYSNMMPGDQLISITWEIHPKKTKMDTQTLYSWKEIPFPQNQSHTLRVQPLVYGRETQYWDEPMIFFPGMLWWAPNFLWARKSHWKKVTT